MTVIKNLLMRNWRPKLICLLLAIGIWLVVTRHRNTTGRSGLGTPTILSPHARPQPEQIHQPNAP